MASVACSAKDSSSSITSSSSNTISTSKETTVSETPESPATQPKSISAEIIGNYTWNPFVWSNTLSETYGESTKDTIYNCINAVMNGDDAFEYSNEEDVWNIYSLADSVCPYLFQIIDYNLMPDNGTVTITYKCSKDEAKKIIEDFGKEVESILNTSIKESDSDEVKAMMLHYNYSSTLNYNYDSLDDNYEGDISTYNAIMNRTGVCQNFASALVHLYLQCGLEANLAGATSDLPHMFVYMTINDETVFIDPTWESEVEHESSGLSFFGINSSVYEENGYTMDPFLLFGNAEYDNNLTSEKYKPLWYTKEVKNITRDDGKLVIEYVNASGEDDTYIVDN